MYLNSKRNCSAVTVEKHPVVSTDQPLIPLIHRILERHPGLISNGEHNGRFWVEPSPAICLDAVLPLGNEYALGREREGQGPQRDWYTSYLHRRTACGKETFESRCVRFKGVNPCDTPLAVVPFLDAFGVRL